MRRIAAHRSAHKRLLLVVAVILLTSVCIAGVVVWLDGTRHEGPRTAQRPEAEQKADGHAEKTVTIAAMGDMIAHDTITSNAKTSAGYDYTKYFRKINSLYKSSDVVFCNQESLSAGESYGISGYPAFNAPTQYAADLQTAGCNVINLANNHMADKGQQALDATVAEWKKLKPLAYAGANRTEQEQRQVRYFEKNGIKFAFLAFADFSNNKDITKYALNLYHDEALVKSLVEEARKNADVVLVSMHWGDEDSHEVNQDQRGQVTKLAELGVDVVIGTGPHVLQEAEYVLRNGGGKMFVWYSIGNMLSSQLELDQLTGGVAKITVRKSGDTIVIENPEFTPTYMSYEWTASEQAAGDINARKNPMIYSLKDSANALQDMRMNTTPERIKQQVQQVIGSAVKVE